MRKKDYITSFFVTDQKIAIYSFNKKDQEKNISLSIDLDDDMIENGYIKKPNQLLLKLRGLFKSLKFVPKNINFVFLGENILIRRLTIKKEDPIRKSIDDYIKSQIGKSLIYPFEKTIYSYQAIKDTELEIQLAIYATDQNLLEDYTDILEVIGVKSIQMSLLSSNINYLLTQEKTALKETKIVASILEHNITVNILEGDIIIFGINHDCEVMKDGVCDIVIEFIERIANYYQYNLKNGKRKIDDVVLVNFNERMVQYLLSHEFDFDFEATALNITDINTNAVWDEKNENLASVASISKSRGFKSPISFDLKRTKKYNIVASYIFIITFFIFSLVSLIFLPLVNYNQDLKALENTNQNLITYQTMLEKNVSNNTSISSFQRNYNLTFEALTEISQSPAPYIIDIMNVSGMDVVIKDIIFEDDENKIVISISSDNNANLYDYAINLYEDYGITDDDNANKWILEEPIINIVSSQTMEVTIYYA